MTTDNRQQATDHSESMSMNKDAAVVGGQSSVVRFFAHFFSYIFHPLFIPFFCIAFLLALHPTYFSGFSDFDKYKLLLVTIVNTVLFPAVAILLMKGLGFIKSIFLHSSQDRIGPYLSAMIFYFWTAWVFFKFQPLPNLVLASFMTGVFLTTVAGLISNIYFKISMHAMGAGGLVGVFLIIMRDNSMLMTWPLSIALLIAGIVCTSRLIVSDHSPKEIYLGLLFGVLCQFAAAIVIL